MHRRQFCRWIAAATTGTQALWAQKPGQVSALDGFGRYAEEYGSFCATAEDQREFFELKEGRFVREKLGAANWEVSPNSESGARMPPALPVEGGSWNGVPMRAPLAGLNGVGPFEATWESLLNYEVPEWYRDAKFGIWAHWGPQCVPEAGDWYARNMYMQGSAQYEYHLKHYGHPSKVGFKDLCARWTLKDWEPDVLMERYKRAGAKFFLALANHHDNLDAWASKHNPWNAMNVGPRRDVVGAWARAARERGLKFGVTVHQPRNWWWFQTAHGADATGPMAAVPYDGRLTLAEGKGLWWEGLDPQRMYAPKHPPMALPDVSYVKDFYDRTRDLIDQHDPDLLYLDNALLPLGWGGMSASAYFYNRSWKKHGSVQGVLTTKVVPERLRKALVADYERGVLDGIAEYPWQSETCIGGWHYDRALFEMEGEFGGYLHPRDVVHWLIDTVSKNGTFILNVPGRPDGTIDSKEIAVLDGLTAWMEVHGEAIYATRPWKAFGEGPGMAKGGAAVTGSVSGLGAEDFRFTKNKAGDVVYAIAMGWPGKMASVRSLGLREGAKVERVELLGCAGKVRFEQGAEALRVWLPETKTSEIAMALKVRLVV